jgi:WhiB family redox-sensing transcriptional regulator
MHVLTDLELDDLDVEALPVRPPRLALPCEVDDGRLWFAEDPADLETAKQRCRDCPIRVECLAGALERREYTGVWGGEIIDRGQIIPFKRRRGRPRKVSCGDVASARAG